MLFRLYSGPNQPDIEQDCESQFEIWGDEAETRRLGGCDDHDFPICDDLPYEAPRRSAETKRRFANVPGTYYGEFAISSCPVGLTRDRCARMKRDRRLKAEKRHFALAETGPKRAMIADVDLCVVQ